MKTYQTKLTEEELRALISHHATMICYGDENINAERSKRLHDLVKRLNDDKPEIEEKETTAVLQTQAQSEPQPWGNN